MSVKNRVKRITKLDKYMDYEGSYRHKRAMEIKKPKYRFKPRYQELQRVEGVYDNPSYPDYPIHISCRYNDLLRCSDTHHFSSCFRPEGEEKYQPMLRCASQEWAIVFVTDKRGAVMSRTWLRFEKGINEDFVSLYRVYGNKLREYDATKIVTTVFQNYMKLTGREVHVEGGRRDHYISFI